jgi:hypothetical protein
MNEKDRSIMNRNEAMATPFLTEGNRIINESPVQPPKRWIEE